MPPTEDGKLSREELVNGYKNILNVGQEEVAEEEVNRIMNAVDKNNSGSIDYTGTGPAFTPSSRFVIRMGDGDDKPRVIALQTASGHSVQNVRQGTQHSHRIDMIHIHYNQPIQDGSGTLSIEEIKELFGATSGISENVWRDMLKEADDNGDGNVSKLLSS